MRYYIVCGEGLGPEYPDFYISKESTSEKIRLGVHQNFEIIAKDAMTFEDQSEAENMLKTLQSDVKLNEIFKRRAMILDLDKVLEDKSLKAHAKQDLKAHR